MAKTSAIQKNLKRIKLAEKFLKKRMDLKKIIKNKKLPLSERFAAQLKLNKLPKNQTKLEGITLTAQDSMLILILEDNQNRVTKVPALIPNLVTPDLDHGNDLP